MTSFDIVIDLALTTINDYKLKKLYNISKDGFQTYCDSFLIRAIPNFVRCKQPLTFNIESRSFEADLTQMEISILADLWVIEWFNKEIQDSTQVQLKLQSSSFSSHSAAQNIKEKSTYKDKLKESVSLKITEYLLEDVSSITEKW